MKEKFSCQKKIKDLKDLLWDVAIIGAGPAGGSLAISLAGENHRVLLIDKETFPRDKICGDLIATYIFKRLKELGIYESICQKGYELKKSDVYKKNYDIFSQDFYKPLLLKSTETSDEIKGPIILKRSVLDAIIAEKSVKNGSVFLKGTVTQIDPQNSHVSLSLEGSDKTIKSKIAVIATGADIKLLKSLDMIEEAKASAVALQCYVNSDCHIEGTIFYYDFHENPAGYCWIFPMGNKIYNTGCITAIQNKNTNIKKVFNDFLSTFPQAKELLSNGEIISKISGEKLRWGLTGTKMSGPGNVMAIGETIGSTRPDSGEGIGRAILSAKFASHVINETLMSGDFSHMRKYPSLLEKSLFSVRKGDVEGIDYRDE
jgi:geranylgeranyl reductase family protein